MDNNNKFLPPPKESKEPRNERRKPSFVSQTEEMVSELQSHTHEIAMERDQINSFEFNEQNYTEVSRESASGDNQYLSDHTSDCLSENDDIFSGSEKEDSIESTSSNIPTSTCQHGRNDKIDSSLNKSANLGPKNRGEDYESSSTLTMNDNNPVILTSDVTNSNEMNVTKLVQEPEEYQSEGADQGVSRTRLARSWSLQSPVSGDDLPNQMLVRVTSLTFDPPRPVSSNHKIKTSLRLNIHSVTHNTSPAAKLDEHFQKTFSFPMDYHSLVFDTLKVDVYEHSSFMNNKKRIGRTFVRLSDLIDAGGQIEYEGDFPLESAILAPTTYIGSMGLKLRFHFPQDVQISTSRAESTPASLESSTSDPLTSSGSSTLIDSETSPIADATSRSVADELRLDENEFASVIRLPKKKGSLGILDIVLNQETRDAIKEITVLYHTFFDHGWRLTKLEFLKAYMFLEKYYSQKESSLTHQTVRDMKKLEDAQKFLKYSMASYGSFLFNWFGYGSGKAPLNAFRMNSDKKNVLEFFKLDKTDVICWEYGKSSVSKPSYMIVRDPETNNILISIRGTMNVTDLITDALAHYEPWNLGFVHRGVLRSAKYLVDHSLPAIRSAVSRFDAPAIQVMGHSLGAAIASIVTMILRDRCRDLLELGIDIHGWNFAPAPCCSLDLAKKAEEEKFIDSFVNENDVIPRLSYGNLMDFKELVKMAASELKNEAYKNASIRLPAKQKLAALISSVDAYHAHLKATSSSRKLYIPGTIYYLHKGERITQTDGNRAYYVKDVMCEISSPEHFMDITLKKNWLFHHFPDRYDKKFTRVIKSLLRENSGQEAKGFWKKIKKRGEEDECVNVGEEGGRRMERWMSRSGHI